MPAPLSMDLRVRIVERYLEDGATVDSVAAQFGVGRASVSRFLRQQRETGHLEPGKLGGGRGSVIADDDLDNVHVLVEEKPDRTQEELVDAYEARTGVRVSRSTMSRALKRAGLSRKKNLPGNPAR